VTEEPEAERAEARNPAPRRGAEQRPAERRQAEPEVGTPEADPLLDPIPERVTGRLPGRRLGEALRAAFRALRANRLRSLLTMLGVIIGVSAVVILVAIGGGARDMVQNEVEGLGSNLILVVPGKFQYGTIPTLSQLTLVDEQLVARVVGSPQDVTASLSSGEDVRAGTREFFAALEGSTQTLPEVFNRPLALGADFTAADVATGQRVVVLGSQVADALFPDEDPVGRQVTVAGVAFRVDGVFTSRGSAFGVTVDNQIDMPITAAQRLLGTQTVSGLAVRAPSASAIDGLGTRIVDALQAKYPGHDFSAVTQSQILGVVGRILSLLTLVLAAIAGISLLVGGVGVSNIMLVSVRERTREIGLRKALGARQRDVLTQFLVEAVVLTAAGGLIGIGVGVGTSALLDTVSPLPARIAWWSPVLAFGVSVSVGVFFGVMPARRAGRLDPAVALRAE
jgi:putative ABC transport system permease protein